METMANTFKDWNCRYSISLNDFEVENNFEKYGYIYAYDLNEGKNYTYLKL